MKISGYIFCSILILVAFQVENIVCEQDTHERFWAMVHLFLKFVLPVFTESLGEIGPDSMTLTFEAQESSMVTTPLPMPAKPKERVSQRPKAPFPFTIFAEFIKYYTKESQLPKGYTYKKPTKENGYQHLRSGLISSLIFIPQISKCGYSLQDAEDMDEKIQNGDMSLSELGIVCLESSYHPAKCQASVPITDDCPRYLTEPPTTTIMSPTTYEPESTTEDELLEETTETPDLIPLFPPYFDTQNNEETENAEGDKLQSILSSFILDNDHRSIPSD